MPPRTRVPAFARVSATLRSLRVIVVVLAVCLATVLAATIATGRVATPVRPVDPAVLTRVVPPPTIVRDAPPMPTAAPARVRPIVDFPVHDPVAAGARPAPELPQPVGVVLVPTPTPPPPPAPARAPAPRAAGSGSSGGGAGVTSTGRQVSGTASWYCQTGVSACHYAYSGGLYAAAGPALRVGDWRGRAVRVCGGGGCVTVRLIDWCQCYGTRVIDLYSDAFRQIAPLSSGTTQVTVSW